MRLHPSNEYIHINVTEIRDDLAAFFRAIDEGKRFAVFYKFTLLAYVGPTERVETTTLSGQATPLPPDTRPIQVSNPDYGALLDVKVKARIERKAY